jgi:hypothetical protein
MNLSSVLIVRFWQKVNIGGTDACWDWQGCKNRKGYGGFSVHRKRQLAHRIAYHIQFGAIPCGMCVLHKCDNPACCNPSHLFLGNRADNNTDMIRKARHNIGEKNGSAKLKRDDVLRIRRLYDEREMSLEEIAHRFNISFQMVSNIGRRINWVWLLD